MADEQEQQSPDAGRHAADAKEDHATPNNGNPTPDDSPQDAGSVESAGNNNGESVEPRPEPHSGDPETVVENNGDGDVNVNAGGE